MRGFNLPKRHRDSIAELCSYKRTITTETTALTHSLHTTKENRGRPHTARNMSTVPSPSSAKQSNLRAKPLVIGPQQEGVSSELLPSPPVSPTRRHMEAEATAAAVVPLAVAKTSPETKQFIGSEAPQKATAMTDSFMLVNAWPKNRAGKGLKSFLKSYEARHSNTERTLPAKRLIAPRVSKPRVAKVTSSKEDPSPFIPPAITPRRSVAIYNSEDENTAPTQKTNYVTGGRAYATRSRKTLDFEDFGTTLSSLNKGTESFNQSTPRSFAGASKKEFLRLCTNVSQIHSSKVWEIPDFVPSMDHITRAQFEKQIKRIGLPLLHDLKSTVDADKVPESELSIVSSFNFSPQQYLENKKRFFAEKARKTYAGETFKKTDAQKACQVDVNKASKLYEVFNSFGLLDDSLFTQQ